MTTLTARLVGGPTAVLEYGGVTWLTDPTLSPPGEYPGGLVKTTGPAFDPDAVDVVLLSHEHHSDNLDPAGRDYLLRAGQVLTTTQGAERLGEEAVGLEPWETFAVGDVTVTGVPALHGPPGSEDVTGPVIGFVLATDGLETVYVSASARPCHCTSRAGPTSRRAPTPCAPRSQATACPTCWSCPSAARRSRSRSSPRPSS